MSDGPAETPKTSSGLWLALGLAAVGFGTAAVNWNSALTEGTYYVSAAAIGPFLGFLGLAMLVAPRTEDVAGKPQRLRTLRVWLGRAMLAIALVAGAANLAVMNGWIPGLP